MGAQTSMGERTGKCQEKKIFWESTKFRKKYIGRIDFVWRGAKQPSFQIRSCKRFDFSCWFLSVVTLKARGRVYNAKGQCFLSYYTGAIQGRRECELKSMLHCSQHLLTGKAIEWKGLGVWHPLARRKLGICFPCSCWYSANTLLLWCQWSKWGPYSNW